MSDYLDRVEAQLSRLTEEGAHRRPRARARAIMGGDGHQASFRGPQGPPPPDGPRPPRRGLEWLAIGAAMAVAAVVAAVVVISIRSSPSHHPSSAAAGTATHTAGRTAPAPKAPTHATTTAPPLPGQPTGSISLPIPKQFYPVSFTATSETTWWILGQAPCTFAGVQPPCAQILRTTDGGRHFIAIAAPRATLATLAASGGMGYSPQTSTVSVFSQLRFAEREDGFAYGPGLYVTHDGGVSWHSVDLGGAVSDLTISGSEAYAMVQTPDGRALMHAGVGGDDWAKLPAAGDVSGGLWVLGAEVIVQSGSGGGFGPQVLVSHDGGASFAAYPAPSPGLPCEFQAQSPPVIWAHCATGTESGVWRSTDGGAHFGPAEPTGAGPRLPNSAIFAAASAATAVAGYQQLYRTADAGATYTPVGPSGIVQWTYLGFTDATHGVGIGFTGSITPRAEHLYYTTDGGQTYHLVPLP